MAETASDPVSILRSMPLFRDLTLEEAGELARLMRRRRLAQGDILCVEGGPGDCAFVIESGRFSVAATAAAGERMDLGTLERGGVVGELCLVEPAPRVASVVALEPSTVLVLPCSKFDGLRASCSPIALKIIRRSASIVAERLRSLSARISGPQAPATTGAARSEQPSKRSFWASLLGR